MDAVTRRDRFATVSTELAHLDDAALRRLVPHDPGSGWGATKTVSIAGHQVFAKAIPLTDLERELQFSTRNHYRLPSFYQYCVESAGFGAWREIVTHVATTNWVLAGDTDALPLLYHYRIVARTGAVKSSLPDDFDEYVRGWNSSKAIARWLTERAAGGFMAVLCLEHLPQTMWRHLASVPADTLTMMRQLCEALTFLHSRGIVHFDAHFNNAVTDGDRAYLIDFGLASDTAFALSPRERTFFESHRHYDYGTMVYSLGGQLVWWYESLSDSDKAAVRTRLGTSAQAGSVYSALVSDVERLTGMAHPTLVAAVVKYRLIIQFMDDFLSRLGADRRKTTPYDDDALRQLLLAAGVLG